MSEMESKSVRDSGALSQFRQDAFDDESDKRFHELLHALPVGVYTTDTVGRITFFNQTAATMWGRRPKLNSEQWCGSWRMYWPDGIALPHHECPMAVAIKQGRSLNGGGQEAVVERPDGTRVPFMAFPSILRDATGEVVGAVNMFVDITERKRSEEQISILAREAEHRAKNVLAIVQATVHLSQSDTAAGLKHAIEGRIRALANVHRLFVESRWSGAELRCVVSQELSPYCQDGETRVWIDGPAVLLEPETAQTIAVALHELATNAAKYGALSVPTGKVRIEWSRALDGKVVLRWTEADGPPTSPPTRRGFGTRVMEGMIGQMNGDIRFDWRIEGLACEIAIPT
ncbi:MAG: HWE histidine kinase domain-containing protein [Xanthobacteraceae bacterium]